MKFLNCKRNNLLIISLLIFAAASIFLPVLFTSDADLANAAVECVKSGDMTLLYGAMAFLSVLLLIGYTLINKRYNKQLVALFSCNCKSTLPSLRRIRELCLYTTTGSLSSLFVFVKLSEEQVSFNLRTAMHLQVDILYVSGEISQNSFRCFIIKPL